MNPKKLLLFLFFFSLWPLGLFAQGCDDPNLWKSPASDFMPGQGLAFSNRSDLEGARLTLAQSENCLRVMGVIRYGQNVRKKGYLAPKDLAFTLMAYTAEGGLLAYSSCPKVQVQYPGESPFICVLHAGAAVKNLSFRAD